MRSLAAVVMFLIFLSGCATFQSANYYPEGKYPPTDPSHIQIYRNDPPRAFEVIGETHLSRGYLTKDDELALKKQAAAMGGDAVVWQLLKTCDEVTITPARTDVVVSQSNAQSDQQSARKEVSTIESTPVQIKQKCAESIEGRVIKFTH